MEMMEGYLGDGDESEGGQVQDAIWVYRCIKGHPLVIGHSLDRTHAGKEQT